MVRRPVSLLRSIFSHWMCYAQKAYASIYGQLIARVEILTQCYLIDCVLVLFVFKPHRNLFFCAIKWKNVKGSLVGFSNLSPVLGKICCNKNVHLVRQHPSLGPSFVCKLDHFCGYSREHFKVRLSRTTRSHPYVDFRPQR